MVDASRCRPPLHAFGITSRKHAVPRSQLADTRIQAAWNLDKSEQSHGPVMDTDTSFDLKPSLFSTTYHLSGTAVARVLSRSEFWFFLGLHLAAWGAYQQGWLHVDNYVVSNMDVDWVDLRMLTLITSFFLTFFTNQSLARYQQTCLIVKRMFGAVHDFASQSRLFMRGLDLPYDRLACRWMALACLLAVIDVQYGEVSNEQWIQLRSRGLVRQEDVDLLRGLSNQQRFLAILHITGEIVQKGLQASGTRKNSDLVVKDAVGRILKFKECHQDLQDTLEVSSPFRYHHLLTVMVSTNLLLLAYGMALTASFLAPCMFILVELTLMGMLLDPCEQPVQGAGLCCFLDTQPPHSRC